MHGFGSYKDLQRPTDNSKKVWIFGSRGIRFGRPYRARTCDTLIESQGYQYSCLCTLGRSNPFGVASNISAISYSRHTAENVFEVVAGLS